MPVPVTTTPEMTVPKRVVLFEPEATLNTGDQQNARTVDPDWI